MSSAPKSPFGTQCDYGKRCTRSGCKFILHRDVCGFHLKGECRSKDGNACPYGYHAHRVDGLDNVWQDKDASMFYSDARKRRAKAIAAKDSPAVLASPPASESAPVASAPASEPVAASPDAKDPASPASTKQRPTRTPGAPRKPRNPNQDRRFREKPKEDVRDEFSRAVTEVGSIIEDDEATLQTLQVGHDKSRRDKEKLDQLIADLTEIRDTMESQQASIFLLVSARVNADVDAEADASTQ